MNAEDVAERFASERDGFVLVDYAEVGLPYWRVRARCEVLATKAISAIDEAVLRGVDIGVNQPADLQILLGLDDVLLDSSVLATIGEDWLRERDGTLHLTDKGASVLSAAREVVSREQVIPFFYDGLLRRATLIEGALEPSQLARRGAREVPPHPARKPDLPELRTAAADIQRLLRAYGQVRDQDAHLLAIKSLDRRERVFHRAVALVFKAQAGREVEIAFAVDDELSAEHEAAFAAAGLAERLGLDRTLRRDRVGDPADGLPDGVREQLDTGREGELRTRVRAAQKLVQTEEGDIAERKEATAELEAARRELAALPVRRVETYEHPRYLRIALGASKRRLLLVSPWITDKVVDAAFLRRLEGRLDDGAEVLLGYGINDKPEADIGDEAAKGLKRLAGEYQNLRFAHLGGGTHAKVLISDDTFAIITSFNWLSFRGDPNRTFRDERGVLLTTATQIEDEWQSWKDQFGPEPQSVARGTVAGRAEDSQGHRRRRR